MLEQRFLSALAISLGTIALTVSSIALVQASSGPPQPPPFESPAAVDGSMLGAHPGVPMTLGPSPCWPSRDAGQ